MDAHYLAAQCGIFMVMSLDKRTIFARRNATLSLHLNTAWTACYLKNNY